MIATIFSIAFAAAVVLVAVSFVLAVRGDFSRRAAYALAGVIGVTAIAAWIGLAYEPELATAVAAGGLTGSSLATLGAFVVSQLVRRGRRLDTEYARVEGRLKSLIETEAAERTADLERMLARARADAASKLAEEERALAEQRRRSLVEHESSARNELAAALAGAQQQVERRFTEWSQDLERIQETLAAQIERIGERQRELIAQVEARIRSDADRIASDSDEQRAAVARQREELGRSLEEVAQAANAELESQAAERRRALHEVADRLRRREEALREQIEREETEAARRISAGFAEIERKQLEQLQRVVDRATSGYSEIAAHEFSEAIKNAREDAAKRLQRELDRAVTTFEREAKGVLSDQLAQISDSGTQRLEKRLGQIAAGLERQRDDAVASLERRLTEAENELMRRLQALVADVDAERALIQSRLQELGRRIDETYARAR